MGEGGHGEAQRLVDEDLARGVGQVVVAADDMGDAHVGVVAYHGEVVGGASVGADQDHVVHDVGGEAHVAVDGIVEFDGSVVFGDLQAPDVLFACVDAGLGFLGAQVAAAAVIAGVLFAGLFGRCALGVQFFLGAEAGIHRAAFLQGFQGGGVGVHALHLGVGAVFSAYFGAFVPIQAQPAHGAQDDLGVFLGGAGGVGIFDAEDELAPVGTGECPVVDSGAGAADVQHARR